MKDALNTLNFPPEIKKQIAKDLKSGRLKPGSVIGMASLITKVTGKECKREVKFYYEGGKYIFIFDLNEGATANVEF